MVQLMSLFTDKRRPQCVQKLSRLQVRLPGWLLREAARITCSRVAFVGERISSGVLLVCRRGLSPSVREGSVAIRAGALPYGRASASLVSWQ